MISVNEFLPDKVVTLIKENMIFCEFYEGIEKYESLDLIADIFFADTGQPEFISFRFYNNKPIKIPDFLSQAVLENNLLFFIPETRNKNKGKLR